MFVLSDLEKQEVKKLNTEQLVLYSNERVAGATHETAMRHALEKKISVADFVANLVNKGR